MALLKQQVNLTIMQPIEVVFDTVSTRFFETVKNRNPSIITIEKTSLGGMGVGTMGKSLSEDSYGRRLDNTYEVTEYIPPYKVAYRTISRFAEGQPNWRKPLNYQVTTRQLHAMTLEPVDGGTYATFSLETDAKIPLYYRLLVWPFWANTYAELYREGAYKLRDQLEQNGGLPQRPRPLYIRPRWMAWGVYLLIFLLLFLLYSTRQAFDISAEIANLLRFVMSLMVALALVIAFMIGNYEYSVRSHARRSQDPQRRG
jgi:hypothetical protein